MKCCCRCKEAKETTEFHRNRSTVDGLNFICKPCKKITARKSYVRHRDNVLAKCREYYDENLEAKLKYARRYCKNTKYRYRADNAKRETERRALKMQTEIYGNSELNDLVFNEAYEISELRSICTKVRHHVDHIIPLKGKAVCGFHVWNNLRVIPYYENCEKSNKLMEDLL